MAQKLSETSSRSFDSEAVKLTHIGVTSIAIMAGAIYAVMGFITGLFYTLFFALFSVFLPRGGIMAGLGIIMLVISTVGGFILGFVCAAIFAIVYNFLAPKIGGVEVELK